MKYAQLGHGDLGTFIVIGIIAIFILGAGTLGLAGFIGWALWAGKMYHPVVWMGLVLLLVALAWLFWKVNPWM